MNKDNMLKEQRKARRRWLSDGYPDEGRAVLWYRLWRAGYDLTPYQARVVANHVKIWGEFA